MGTRMVKKREPRKGSKRKRVVSDMGLWGER